jgi:hypothetical protein
VALVVSRRSARQDEHEKAKSKKERECGLVISVLLAIQKLRISSFFFLKKKKKRSNMALDLKSVKSGPENHFSRTKLNNIKGAFAATKPVAHPVVRGALMNL